MLDWPTLSSLILSHIPLYRRNDLHSLLLTSKSFHTAAEPLVYHHIIFTDVRRIILFATSLSESPRLAGLVHTFGINLSELRMRAQVHRHEALNVQTVLRRVFWEAVKAILGAMTALESLVVVHIPGMRMNFNWILDGEVLPFALKDVKLHLAFDNHVARFLNAQGAKGQLRAVQIYNMAVARTSDGSVDPATANDSSAGIEDIRLPDIEVLDISLSITPHISLTGPHFAHLQLYIDVQVTTASVLVDTLAQLLSPGRKSLRGLSLIDVPASLSTSLLSQMANSLVLSNLVSTLSHLAHFHLPRPYTPHSSSPSPSTATTTGNTRSRARSRNSLLIAQENQILLPPPPGSTEQSTKIANEKLEFLHSLTSFRSLRSLELSLNSWDFFDTSHTTIHNFTYYQLHPQQNPPLSSTPTGGGGNTIPSPVTQKILLSELKMYCPSLRIVVLWLGKVRFRWQYVVYEEYYHGDMEVLYTGMVPSWEKEQEEVDPGVVGDDDVVEQELAVEGTGKRRGGGSGTTVKVCIPGHAGGTGSSTIGGSSASVSASTGSGGGSVIDCGPRKLQNAVIPGEWHCKMDVNQWPALSTLWSNA